MDSESDSDVIEISDTDSRDGNDQRTGLKRKWKESHDVSDNSSDGIVWMDEDSESEPELECEFWDRDCRVILSEIRLNSTKGYHLMPTCSLESTQPCKLAKRVPELNTNLTNTETITKLKTNWQNHNSYSDNGVEIITKPWQVCVINNLLDNPEILEDIRQEFNELEWNKRTMDLYEFFQTDDLVKLNNKKVNAIYDLISKELKSWVSEVMDLELSEVSATCSYYSDTDYLLVHDDQRGNRAVAFVLYLTGENGWNKSWKGDLQLLDSDEDGQPLNENTREIIPCNNQLVLFPVTDRSYHQVLEVQTKDYCRLSINGWFHTPNPMIFDSPRYMSPTNGLHSEQIIEPMNSDLVLEHWLCSSFLRTRTAEDIQQHLEEHSEISLDQYLKEDKLKEITKALSSEELVWTRQGPINRRNYTVLDTTTSLPPPILNLLQLFQSSTFFRLLYTYTDLRLDRMRYELQRWQRGDYHLLSSSGGGGDTHHKNHSNDTRLDVIYYIGESCEGVVGGRTTYVTLEDRVQSALVTVQPKENTLNLVYGDTACFTSLVSRQSGGGECFYVVFGSYYEQEEGGGSGGGRVLRYSSGEDEDEDSDGVELASGGGSFRERGGKVGGETSLGKEGEASKQKEREAILQKEGESNFVLKEGLTSFLKEGETSEQNAGLKNEGKPSFLKEGKTSEQKEGETSFLKDGETGVLKEEKNSVLKEGETSVLEERITSDLNEGETSVLAEEETSLSKEGKTSLQKEGEASDLNDGETSVEKDGETSLQNVEDKTADNGEEFPSGNTLSRVNGDKSPNSSDDSDDSDSD